MKITSVCTVLLLLTITSCSGQSHKKNEVLQAIVDSEIMENYLHLKSPDRTPLYFIKNEIINDQVDVSLNGQKVKLLESETSSVNNYLKFLDLKIEKQKAQFKLFYKIENMEIHGILLYNDSIWSIAEIIEVIEF